MAKKAAADDRELRFILKARKGRKTGGSTVEESLTTFEEGIASLARSAYQRGSASAHTATDGSEIKKLKGYVDALLVELLELA